MLPPAGLVKMTATGADAPTTPVRTDTRRSSGGARAVAVPAGADDAAGSAMRSQAEPGGLAAMEATKVVVELSVMFGRFFEPGDAVQPEGLVAHKPISRFIS